MLSFAIVSLSRCSAAISSSTGATILHGPHHSAQKSTSTGLSLPRTSLAKLASVTVTVLPAMEVLLLDGYCWEDRVQRSSKVWGSQRAASIAAAARVPAEVIACR